ncbi:MULTISPECIES: 23S rRNA (adenine(2030)-N(6))-methyltransferase RlmJ [Halomonadaceae]|uniref:23S rRNA (adenine(2030)-N(6))-methyltransferase RlmJ n=1 Tax=Halomonadaceae TaxID=28256 RepID=UPI001598E8B2|nr:MULTISPECIES: 23S rRNA (adenine(2030)-N(6))-methyltransferase RlmJ [Halomonas]QJQ95595.1 23S rRNA (adenine(2030)-N(6))-methyltransferase RlmJ [Halomonas sp. PA5]
MLAYQHVYHAGNFADVHKHLTLFATLEHILRKESPVTYIDTHAGRGLYPLVAEETQKLQEYRQGVDLLWKHRASLQRSNPLLGDWLSCLAEVQASRESELSHYPGSPWWLGRRLRRQDRLQLFELHPGEHQHLEAQSLPRNATRTYGDGLKGVVQILPAATPRICVLIDPSYEQKAEYARVADVVTSIARKARHAQVLVWYPLLPAGRHRELLERLLDSGLRKLWRSELSLRAPGDSQHGMYGSGMLIFNPSWGLDGLLGEALQPVVALLGREARYEADWWVPE